MATRPPSEQAFRTYANYLRAWRLTADQFNATSPVFGWNVAPQVYLSEDRQEQLRNSLYRYWGNLRALEILNSGQMAAEVLAVHPPIAYYAVHNASCATLIALGQQPSNSHDGVLAQMAELCKNQQLRQPWCAYALSSPKSREIRHLGEFEWPSSNLTEVTVGRARGFAAMSLTTTRNDAIDLALERQRGGRARVRRGSRKKKEQSLRPTTVFDLFYRYRRVAHYGKADNFMQFESEEEAVRFGDDLYTLADALTKTLEVRIQRRVGSNALGEFYEDYTNLHGITLGEGAVGRRHDDLLAPF